MVAKTCPLCTAILHFSFIAGSLYILESVWCNILPYLGSYSFQKLLALVFTRETANANFKGMKCLQAVSAVNILQGKPRKVLLKSKMTRNIVDILWVILFMASLLLGGLKSPKIQPHHGISTSK